MQHMKLPRKDRSWRCYVRTTNSYCCNTTYLPVTPATKRKTPRGVRSYGTFPYLCAKTKSDKRHRKNTTTATTNRQIATATSPAHARRTTHRCEKRIATETTLPMPMGSSQAKPSRMASSIDTVMPEATRTCKQAQSTAHPSVRTQQKTKNEKKGGQNKKNKKKGKIRRETLNTKQRMSRA